MSLPFLKPRIITLNERRIHICRKPGFLAWLLFGLFTIIFIQVSWTLSRNLLHTISLLLGQIVFLLDAFGEWQNVLLDKDRNEVIFESYNWPDEFYSRIVSDSCISMKLSDIRYVGASIEMGLFILNKDGKTKSLSMQGFTRKELQQLKNQINRILTSN